MDKSINLDPNLALKLPLTDHSTNVSEKPLSILSGLFH